MERCQLLGPLVQLGLIQFPPLCCRASELTIFYMPAPLLLNHLFQEHRALQSLLAQVDFQLHQLGRPQFQLWHQLHAQQPALVLCRSPFELDLSVEQIQKAEQLVLE